MVLKQLSEPNGKAKHPSDVTRGFTIIELMVAIAIVALIATFAYGSYAEQVQKSRRSAAQAALMELANFMERYYTDNGTYSTGNNNAPQLPFDTLPKTGTPINYKFSIEEVSDQSYKLVATPVGQAQLDDACGAMSLDHAGKKLPRREGCWIN